MPAVVGPRVSSAGRGQWVLLAGVALAGAVAMRVGLPRGPVSPLAVPPSARAVAIPGGGVDPGDPGPHAAGWRTVSVTDPDGGNFAALLTYPARTATEGAAPDAAGAPYPAVAFGHGFFQAPERYQGTLRHLASWGYVTIAPASHAGLTPDHAAFAADLYQSLDWLVARSSEPDAWWTGLVDPAALGASGHSMGGGASLVAAAEAATIRAVVSLAAAETRPSAAAVLPRVDAPLAFIVGQADRIVPPASTAALYEAAGPPRQLLELGGGTHCGFQDDPFPLVCDGGRDEGQLLRTRRLLTAFFELYLRGDARWTEWVWGPSPYDGEVAAARVDPGLSLLPAKSSVLVPAGGTAEAPFTVTNTGRAAARFGLMVSSGTWPAALSADTTPELTPGTAFRGTVTFRRPAGAPLPANPLSYTIRATAPDGRGAAFAIVLVDGRAPGAGPLTLPWLGRALDHARLFARPGSGSDVQG